MKKEAVDCPVKLKVVSFVEFIPCPNFNHKIRGMRKTGDGGSH